MRKYCHMPVAAWEAEEVVWLMNTPSRGFCWPGYPVPKVSLVMVWLKSKFLSGKGTRSCTCMLPC